MEAHTSYTNMARGLLHGSKGPGKDGGREGGMGLKSFGALKGKRWEGGREHMRELVGQRCDGVAKEKSCNAREQQKQADNVEQLEQLTAQAGPHVDHDTTTAT